MSQPHRGPQRRLDLSSANCSKIGNNVGASSSANAGLNSKKVVYNPYLKRRKHPSPTAQNSHLTEKDGPAETVAYGTVTPDTSNGKFFQCRSAISKRPFRDNEVKPNALRKLVTPLRGDQHEEEDVQMVDSIGNEQDLKATGKNEMRKGYDEFGTESKYYDSEDETATSAPIYIHSSLNYHHRGELPLDEGKMKAYRFIRTHFWIPYDIEANPKFGPHSGSCFEERVFRAYSLGQLKPKRRVSTTSALRRKYSNMSLNPSHLIEEESLNGKSQGKILWVCTHCGNEGHIRDDCPKLL